MRNIIITGSSGLVATELIHYLLAEGCFYIYAVTTSPEKLKKRYADKNNISCITLEELEALAHEIKECTALVHCAFARKEDGNEIATSLDYCKKTLMIVGNMRLDAFINISSQSIYGRKMKSFRKETDSVDPEGLYGIGKYATELLVDSYLKDTDINYTNIRLSSVCENARFMNTFVKNAMLGLPIKVIGGRQKCSFIDVRDVANALLKVLESVDNFKFAPVYNLGTGTNRCIFELAEDVQRILSDCGYSCQIEKTDADTSFEIGMDNSLFCNDFGWKPEYGYDDMIKSLMVLNGFVGQPGGGI